MALTIDGTSLMDITLDGVNMKYVNLDNVLVFTRVDLPVFTKQPNGGTVNNTQSFTSSVAVDPGDGAVTYQWFLNNAPQPNSNKPTYTFPPRGVGGYTIRCEATNSRGKAVSNNAHLNVIASFTHVLTVGSAADFAGPSYGFGQPMGGMIGNVQPRTVEGRTITNFLATGLGTTLGVNAQIHDWVSIRVTLEDVSMVLTWGAPNAPNNYGTTNPDNPLAAKMKANVGKNLNFKVERA